MAVITFDCDEVLANSVQAMLDHHNNRLFGIDVEREDIHDYHIEKIDKFIDAGVRFEQARDMFDDFFVNHGLEKIAPIAGMPAVVQSLKRQGHELYVVTARHETIQTQTLQWVEKHFGGAFSDVVFTNFYADSGHKQCKGDVCRYMGSQIMAEDSIIHAEKIAAQGIDTLIPHKPRNKHHQSASPHIHSVQDAVDIEQILVEKGFL